MASPRDVKLGQRGVLTLPVELRQEYDLKPGDRFTLLDLDGVFVLSPQVSRVDELADRVSQELIEAGETLESMLKTLREERENYDRTSQRLP